jgi:hypothetical protein
MKKKLLNFVMIIVVRFMRDLDYVSPTVADHPPETLTLTT